jgi:hydrogenase maturation protease HycI
MEEKKTSKQFWSEQLDQILAKAAATKQQNNDDPTPLRVAVVGVGNELNGDDAAGNQVAARLLARSGFPEHFLPILAGAIPENASGPLRRFRADLVIMIDAADFGGTVGEIRWLNGTDISGFSASSHTLPLPVLGHYLEEELNCRVEYLGIQPAQLEFGSDLTAEVEQAVRELVNVISNKFGEKNR